MISFRFYLVTLVALFLALSVGIVIGSTVVDRAIVDGLRNRVEAVADNLDARRADNEVLRAANDDLVDAFGVAGRHAVAGRGAGSSSLIAADRGVDEGAVGRLLDALTDSGAETPGVLWLEESWALDQPEDRIRLAELVDTPITQAAALRERVWAQLALALSAPEISATGLVSRLEEAGFVSYVANTEVNLDRLARPLGVILVTGWATERAGPGPVAEFAAPMAAGGLTAMVAEVFSAANEGPARGAILASVRDSNMLSGLVATVDHLDLDPGEVAAVLALTDALDGTIGHYGYGEGANAPLPDPSAP